MVVRALSRCLQPAYYLRHEYIVRKDDVAEEIFFIDNGKVEVVSEDGAVVFDTMSSGEAFGEVGVMYNVPRTASVRAQVSRGLAARGSRAHNVAWPSTEFFCRAMLWISASYAVDVVRRPFVCLSRSSILLKRINIRYLQFLSQLDSHTVPVVQYQTLLQ